MIRNADDAPVEMIGTVLDVTEDTLRAQERDEALAALAQSEEQYRLLTENAYDVIWTMGVDGAITYVSPSVERVRGITPAEAAVQTLDQIHPPDSVAKVADYFGRLYAAMGAGEVPPTYRAEHEYYRKDGSIMLGALQVIPQVDAEGRVVQILGVTRDISAQRDYENELGRLAVTDPLTGVWNRRHGSHLFSEDLADAQRMGMPLALLMIDVDHFKRINDGHGHQVGDRVIVELTSRMMASLGRSDTFVRWGGEEFVVLLRDATLDVAVARAEALRTLAADAPFDDVGVVTVSIGVAGMHQHDDLASIMERADRAMYRAKSAGRNKVQVESAK